MFSLFYQGTIARFVDGEKGSMLCEKPDDGRQLAAAVELPGVGILATSVGCVA